MIRKIRTKISSLSLKRQPPEFQNPECLWQTSIKLMTNTIKRASSIRATFKPRQRKRETLEPSNVKTSYQSSRRAANQRHQQMSQYTILAEMVLNLSRGILNLALNWRPGSNLSVNLWSRRLVKNLKLRSKTPRLRSKLLFHSVGPTHKESSLNLRLSCRETTSSLIFLSKATTRIKISDMPCHPMSFWSKSENCSRRDPTRLGDCVKPWLSRLTCPCQKSPCWLILFRSS